MSNYWKAFIAGMIWTALEGLAAVAAVYAATIDDPVIKGLIGVGIAVAIFAAKTLKLGFPETDPAQSNDAYENDVEPVSEEIEEDENEA